MPRALRIALLILGAVAVVFATVRLWKAQTFAPAIDFYLVYVNVEVAGRDDIANIYSAEAQSTLGEEFFGRALGSGQQAFHATATIRRSLDSRGSPFLYASFGWISSSYERALTQSRALLFASLFAGMLLLGRYCRIPLWATLFGIAAIVSLYLPFHGDVSVGNVNAIQLFLLALALTLGARYPAAAGAILAMMLAAKPNVVLVVVVLVIARLLARDFARLRRELAGGVVGGLLAFVVGSLFFETPRIWLQWLQSAGGLYQTLLGVEFNNVTPALPLYQQYGTGLSYAIAAGLLVIAILPLLRRRQADDLVLLSIGLLVYFMSATLVWIHYLVLALFPAYALFRSRFTAPLGAIALLLFADVPLQMLTGSPSTPELRAKLDLVAMVMLYAGCVGLLWRGEPRESRA